MYVKHSTGYVQKDPILFATERPVHVSPVQLKIDTHKLQLHSLFDQAAYRIYRHLVLQTTQKSANSDKNEFV